MWHRNSIARRIKGEQQKLKGRKEKLAESRRGRTAMEKDFEGKGGSEIFGGTSKKNESPFNNEGA